MADPVSHLSPLEPATGRMIRFMGQKKRQRAKRLLAHLDGRSPAELIDWANCRGDAAQILEKLRGLGPAYRPAAELFERWANASLSDLVQLRKAINADNDIAPYMKAAIVAAVCSRKLDQEEGGFRTTLSLARTFIAADEANLRMIERLSPAERAAYFRIFG